MKNKREYGIDILRILSMMMVLVLHVFSNGGAMDALPFKSLNYYVGWFLESMCFCAVDIFAMVTGYLMVDKKVEYWKFIPRWLQAWFISAGITTCYAVFAGGGHLSLKEWAVSILPLTFSEWKYFTEYFGAVLFMPYINLAIRYMTALQHKVLLLVLSVALPTWTTFSFNDPMNLLNGYSTVWIVMMYVVGALIRKTRLDQKITKSNAIILYFTCVILSWFAKVGCEALFGTAFPRITDGNGFLLRYVSPTVVWAAVALVVFFGKIKSIDRRFIPIVKWMSSVSFGVFLIHTQVIVRTRIYTGAFVKITTLSTPLFLAIIVLSTIAIYFACGLLDHLRQCLFDSIGVNEKVKKLYGKTRTILVGWLDSAL